MAREVGDERILTHTNKSVTTIPFHLTSICRLTIRLSEKKHGKHPFDGSEASLDFFLSGPGSCELCLYQSLLVVVSDPVVLFAHLAHFAGNQSRDFADTGFDTQQKTRRRAVHGRLYRSIILAGWTMFGPMKESVINLSSEIPEYWERIQKPIIRLDQQATLSKEKLQEEVFIEIVEDDKEKDKPASVEKSTEAAKIPDQGDTILSTMIGILRIC
jgi:hypothetical protein